MWVQVPSSALERKQSRSNDLLFFRSQAEEFLEPKVQGRLRSATVCAKPRSPRPRAPRPDGLRRSVRWEKGPLDLFLFPPHPIFRWRVYLYRMNLAKPQCETLFEEDLKFMELLLSKNKKLVKIKKVKDEELGIETTNITIKKTG